MDKIERYKNLNEQVNRLLKKQQSSSLKEEAVVAAQELFETLQDPNRVTQLMKAGLVDSARINRVRSALKDPEKAIKNPSIRTDLINMLMSLINLVTSNPSAYSSVRKGLDKEEEVTEEKSVKKEELIGNQKKIDINDNDKIDAQDLKMLRSGKKKATDELDEMASRKASATGKKYRDDGGVHDAEYWERVKRMMSRPMTPEEEAWMQGGADDHLPGIGDKARETRAAAIRARRAKGQGGPAASGPSRPRDFK